MPILQKGSATVTLEGKQMIICRLVGAITGSVVKESVRRTKEYADQILAAGKKPQLLIDISKITQQTSAARSEAKTLNQLGLERIAVSGGKGLLVMLGRYIARAGGMGDYTKFFRTEAAARYWLAHGDVTKRNADDTITIQKNIAALLVVLIAVGALVGWKLGVPVLTSVIPGLKPMNPIVAVTLLLLAAGLACMGHNLAKHPARRAIIAFAGVWALLLGIIVLIGHFYPINVYTNGPLYVAGKDLGYGTISTGVAITSNGLMVLLIASGQRAKWQLYSFYVFASIVAVITLGTFVAYGFGLDWLYGLNSFKPMALNTVIALMILAFGLAAVARPIATYGAVMRFINAYWQALVVLLILVISTGVVWQLVKRDIARGVQSASQEAFSKVQNTITSRLATYTDTLNGFRGFFVASSSVTPAEFRAYFTTSELATNYPGFNAISYAATVPDAQKQAFGAATRSLATNDFPQYKSFSMFPENNNKLHYPLMFVEPQTSTTRYGFDLSSERTRLESLEKASLTGKPVSSGIINLNASRPDQPKNPGFFLALPIFKNGTAASHIGANGLQAGGFILAYFQNSRLFTDLFKEKQSNNVRYVITDAATGQQLYTSEARNVAKDAPLVQSSPIQVADKGWRLNMYLSPSFGKSGVEQSLPIAVLVSGAALSALATALVFGQLRRRDQALQLAAHITEDLNQERNTAVGLQRKDEAILSSIGDAVFAVDLKGRITLFNEACEHISGYSRDEALGRPYDDVLHFLLEKSKTRNDSFIKDALAGRIGSMKGDTVLVHKDGKEIAVADSAAPIHDSHGDMLGAIVVFRDVSKEKELDRAKTEFVSLASHQLRTPLSAINWYSELLLEEGAEGLTKSQRQYLDEIAQGNKRMVELVNSLLDVSRLDLGKLSNKPAANDAAVLVESLEKELAATIRSKKLHIIKNIPPNLPPIVTDPKLLRIIVQNLFSNAVKYTPDDGTVELTIRPAQHHEVQTAGLKPGRTYCLLSCRDTGYGVPKAQQPKIFTKLFRADNVRVLDVEGTGLGLYLVQQVTEKLGGRIWFESAEGKGSTFHVLLPFKTVAMRSDTKQPSSE